MGVKITNNASGTLAAAITSGATTLTLTSGQGALFPTLGVGDYCWCTLVDTSNNVEIIKVTARSTDTLTMTRGQDNTTAQAFAINDRLELRPTAALFAEFADPAMGGDLTGTASNAQIAANAVGLAEMAGGTDGNLITYDASGDPAYVTTGTSGQVLTSGGTGVAPTFQTAAGGGKVLQVLSITKTDTFTTTSTSFVDVTSLSVSITPSATSSKILIIVDATAGQSSSSNCVWGQIVRDSTILNIGDAGGSRTRCGSAFQTVGGANYQTGMMTAHYLDTPSSVSSLTYKFQLSTDAGGTACLNRSGDDSNAVNRSRAASNITVMEIGA